MSAKQRWLGAILFLGGIACGLMISLSPLAQAQEAAELGVDEGRYDASFSWVAAGLGGASTTVVDRQTNTLYVYIAPREPDKEAENGKGPAFHLAATLDLTSAGKPQLTVQWEDPPQD